MTMKQKCKIAVLMTCYNRRETTLACLETLYAQKLPDGISFKVFLVDDGCTDETGAAVKSAYPDVEVILGTGALFWCNGMRLAWDHAAKEDPDFYLWLNDDVELFDDAIERLLSCWLSVSKGSASGNSLCDLCSQTADDLREAVIVVGSTCDPETGEHTYGGQRRGGRHPGKLTSVLPQKTLVECDTFEGNVVLVPCAVYQRVGNMRSFGHAMGDTDYGYRARQCGCRIVVAPGFFADCDANLAEDIFKNETLSFFERVQILVKRIPPKDWWKFLKEHAGLWALLYFPMVYVRFLVKSNREK